MKIFITRVQEDFHMKLDIDTYNISILIPTLSSNTFLASSSFNYYPFFPIPLVPDSLFSSSSPCPLLSYSFPFSSFHTALSYPSLASFSFLFIILILFTMFILFIPVSISNTYTISPSYPNLLFHHDPFDGKHNYIFGPEIG